MNGADLEALAREHGTPLFVYDLARPAENVRALQAALRRAGRPHRVRFALKAGPDPRDPARPARARRARVPRRPSASTPARPARSPTRSPTAGLPGRSATPGPTSSERDLDVLLAHPIRINLDAVSQLERVGRRAPGRTRRDPDQPGRRAPATRSTSRTPASGRRSSAITADRLDDAIDAVPPPRARRGHAPLPRGVRLARRPARRVRAGAGRRDRGSSTGCADAGLPDPRGQRRWRARPAGPRRRAAGRPRRVRGGRRAATSAPYGVTAAFEPGDYVMKDAAVLLGEVVSVERRGDTTFVGLDIGWNVNCSYFIYRYAQEILPVRDPLRAADAAGHGRGPHQRGRRRVRRGLPVRRRRGGRARRDPQRRAAISRRCR